MFTRSSQQLNAVAHQTIINKMNMKHLKKFCIYFIAIFTIA